MCMMAGLVSRVVIGYALAGVNYFSPPYIDHAWINKEMQIGQKINLYI